MKPFTRAIGVLVLTGSAFAQEQTAPAGQPTFRAATQIVEVDVVVTDGRGQLIRDLTREDFHVLDEGSSQRIETFYSFFAPGPPQAAPAVPPPPSAAQPSRRRTFIFVLDDAHLAPAAFKRLQTALEQFISTTLQPGDVAGLVTGGAMANGRLTSDREELVAAVRRAEPTDGRRSRLLDSNEFPRLRDETEAIRIDSGDREALQQAVRRAYQDDPELCGRVDCEFMAREKARRMAAEVRVGAERTLALLRALASGLQRIEGRKTVVLLTEGFSVNQAVSMLTSITKDAAQSRVVFYAIDARGLDRSGGRDVLGGAGADDAPEPGSAGVFDTREDAPNALAVNTGGFVVRNTNNFGQALAEIGRDTGSYYVLGFRSAAGVPESTFRRIEVKMNRPGLRVRARRGYVVAPPLPIATSDRSSPPQTPAIDPALATTAAFPATPAGEPSSNPGPAAPIPDAPKPGARASVRLRPGADAHVTALSGAKSVSASDAAARGWEYYERGDLESAEAALRIAVADPGAPAWAHYALGQAHYALARYREAAGRWEQVRRMVPEFQPVYYDLADAYLQVQEYGAGISVLRAASTRWPANAETFNALGVLQIARGALDDAIESFGKAIEVAPDDGLAYFNLARACELRYVQSRRYDRRTGRWFVREADRRRAAEHYERYLAIGGPYENAAREGLLRLAWQPR